MSMNIQADCTSLCVLCMARIRALKAPHSLVLSVGTEISQDALQTTSVLDFTAVNMAWLAIR